MSLSCSDWERIQDLETQKLKAVEMILNFGGSDGADHKQWTLDQTLRILLGDHYESTIEMYENEDEHGDKEYIWETGTAP